MLRLNGASPHRYGLQVRRRPGVTLKTPTAERVVPVMWWLTEPLERYIGSIPPGLLWSKPEGGQIDSVWWWQRIWDPAMRASGIRLRWHDLRHFAASLWIATGADVQTVASVLGHASPAMTLSHYVHAFRAYQVGARLNMDEVAAKILRAMGEESATNPAELPRDGMDRPTVVGAPRCIVCGKAMFVAAPKLGQEWPENHSFYRCATCEVSLMVSHLPNGNWTAVVMPGVR